jgi:hypothetical protein
MAMDKNTTNGRQAQTGIVHAARVTQHVYTGVVVLSPMCQRIGNARAYLQETDEPVTCRRCIAKAGPR